MLTILENGVMTGIFFSFDDNDQSGIPDLNKIAKWIEENLNQFELNEAFSCTVDVHGANKIYINGDEDFVELLVKNLDDLAIKL